MPATMNVADQVVALSRGCEAVYTPPELEARLRLGRPLRVKLGMDPTAPDIHLGHAVVLRKMRQFQDAGHQGVLIIGDYTARIGDPTGRDTTRPVLDDAAIARNARTYLDQAGLILDTAPEKLEVRHNSEWLGGLTFADVLQLTGKVTVQQMLHRDNFARRLEAGREIMLSEFMYPLMQGYDSVVIRADVELGGTDQTFNNLVGRDLQARAGLDKQVVMVLPLLVGLDGHEKMSKSKGNYVGLTDPPEEMFGKLMSIPDTLMANYFTLLTPLPPEQVAVLCDAGATHPRQAKDTLARTIVAQFHGRAAADAASDAFRKRFSEGQLPDQMPQVRVPEATMGILQLITHAGFAASLSEARRLVQQGGVTLDGRKVTDPRATVTLAPGAVLQVGKRRVCRLIL